MVENKETTQETTEVKVEDKKNRQQKRNEAVYEKRYAQYQFSANTSDQEFRALATKALKGELTPNEWSRLTPALRKKLDRFTKKIKKVAKNTDFLSQLPADAIVKDITLNEDQKDDKNTENEVKNIE